MFSLRFSSFVKSVFRQFSALRIAQAHHENELCEDQFRIRMALLLCAARTTGAVAKIR
jgi:hypothetical protein